MRNLFLIAFVATIFAACNNQSQKAPSSDTSTATATDTTKPADENKIQIATTVCYAAMHPRDTTILHVEKLPNVVTGTLSYKIFQKDINNGEFDGVLHGDTLIASYNFSSEGKRSVRQIAFLLTDSTATEGFGDMQEKNDSMFFKNISSIDFSKGKELNKTDCPQQ